MSLRVLPSEYTVPKGYARGVVAGDFVFLSGVGGIDPGTDTVLRTMTEQATMIVKRIEGSSIDNIVKVVTYVTDLKLYREQGNAIVKKALPARAGTLVCVKELARDGMMIEVDVTALIEK
jgi:enamine deaminase RidA (YjgF/YER057c/UK114 family)